MNRILHRRVSRLETAAADREAMRIIDSLSDAELIECLQELGRYHRLFRGSSPYEHLSDEELEEAIERCKAREEQERG